MDKQTKVFVTIGNEKTEVMFSNQKEQTKPLFVFTEYGRCEIEFYSEEETAYLEIESMTEEGIIKLMPSHSFLLSSSENPDECYVPGNFSIRLIQQHQKTDGYFSVLPQNLSEESLKKMCDLLEEKAQGVTRNLHSHQLMIKGETQSTNELDLFGFLIQHFEELMESITRVIRYPIEDLEQVYQLTKSSKKPTTKSQRWLDTKGQRYATADSQERFYEKRNAITYNTVENRSLKHMLFQISDKILGLIKSYRANYKSLLQQQTLLEVEIENLRFRRDNISDFGAFKKTKAMVNRELDLKTDELDALKQRIEIHQRYTRQIQEMHGHLLIALNDSWMSEVPMAFNGRVTKRFLKTSGYAFIYELHQKIMLFEDEGIATPTFPLHQTSRLFEYYNIFLIIELLKKQGFIWKKGWLKDFKRSSYQTYHLEAGETLSFEDDRGYRIRLSYDKFLKTSSEAKFTQEKQMVSVNSMSRRPDILIELFHEEKFLSSMVVEVKYRKVYSVYQDKHETNAVKQLLDYRALNYYDPSQRPMLKQNVVDTLLIVYPSHEGGRFIYDELYDLKVIPLSPTGFDEKTEGVEAIQTALTDFLNRY